MCNKDKNNVCAFKLAEDMHQFTYHGDVVAIKQDLVQFGNPPSLWCDFTETKLYQDILI